MSLKQWADVASGRGVAVPEVPQESPYTCGPAVLRAALGYFGKHVPSEPEVADALGTSPSDGTTYEAMVEGAKNLGLDAELVEGVSTNYLAASLDEGELPIVPLQAWNENTPAPGGYEGLWTNAHFVVVVAVDLDGGDILFEDPAIDGSRAYLTIPEFESRWHVVKDGEQTEGVAIIMRGDGPTALRTVALGTPKPMP